MSPLFTPLHVTRSIPIPIPHVNLHQAMIRSDANVLNLLLKCWSLLKFIPHLSSELKMLLTPTPILMIFLTQDALENFHPHDVAKLAGASMPSLQQ